jgi:ketosteroid isomerase-like protein
MAVDATQDPNARRMREVAEAVARGDVPTALEHFPEDVVWYWPADAGEDRVYRGRDGLARFFGRLNERSNGTMRPEVEDVLGSDEHVVAFLRITAERDDERLDARVAHFATVGPNGFARNWFLPNDTTAWNRFFG